MYIDEGTNKLFKNQIKKNQKIKTFDQVKKHNFDQLKFDQVIVSRYLPANIAQYCYTSITSSDEIFIKLVMNIVDPFRII
jgi:hypothetical protein